MKRRMSERQVYGSYMRLELVTLTQSLGERFSRQTLLSPLLTALVRN